METSCYGSLRLQEGVDLVNMLINIFLNTFSQRDNAVEWLLSLENRYTPEDRSKSDRSGAVSG